MQDSSGLQFPKSSTLGCTSCPRATRGPQMPCGLASGDGFPNLRVNALRSAYPIRRVLKDLGNLSMRLLKGVRRGSNPRPKLAKLLLPAVEKAESKMVRKRPNPSALPFFLIALKSLNVGANLSTYWSRNSDAQIREQRGNIKRSLPFLAVILCSFGYPQVLEIPDQGALSRQRSRVRVSSSPPYFQSLTPFVCPNRCTTVAKAEVHITAKVISI